MDWRLIIDEPRDGASNMAADEALFEGVQAGGRPVLRLYRWHPPCLSLGRNQAAAGAYDTALARARGIDIVRRPTGGLAVYHDNELTYAVALPVGVLGRPRETYSRINRALALALTRLGVPALTQPAAAMPAPARSNGNGSSPCFTSAVEGEVTAVGRKLVGSAQRCENRMILQHGSILMDGDQSEAVRLARAGGMQPASIGIAQVIGRTPAWSEVHDAVIGAVVESCAVRLQPDTLSATERDRMQVLVLQYRSEVWTWRR